MSSTELTRLSLNDIETVALRAAHSGHFGFAKPEQAYMVVLAGQEVGIGPFRALNGIHIIQGKPVVGSGVLAGLVKQSGKYDYRLTKHTAEECVIAFFEGGDHVGDSRFTIEMAQRAGLTSNATWKKTPENMLFARAMSNGVKWFAPDVTAGQFYVEGEVDDASSPAPPRDVVATVEVEPVPVVEMADPGSVRLSLRSLSPEQRATLKSDLADLGVDLGSTQKSAVEAICADVTAEAFLAIITEITEGPAENVFPDGLADVQAQHANGTPASPSAKRDKHDDAADTEAAELFGEAMQTVASVPAYGHRDPA